MQPCVIHSFSEKYNTYLVRENDNSVALNFWSETDIDKVMSKQEKMIQFDKEQKEKQRKIEEVERIEQEKYNNVFGFCDKMTTLQKGKVLKSLNMLVKYDKYGTITRKEFILKTLEDGLKPIVRHNVKYYSRRAEEGYTVKPVVYSMDAGDYDIDITKTEYDYALHLIKNGIV
jgi:hypothetical protein